MRMVLGRLKVAAVLAWLFSCAVPASAAQPNIGDFVYLSFMAVPVPYVVMDANPYEILVASGQTAMTLSLPLRGELVRRTAGGPQAVLIPVDSNLNRVTMGGVRRVRMMLAVPVFTARRTYWGAQAFTTDLEYLSVDNRVDRSTPLDFPAPVVGLFAGETIPGALSRFNRASGAVVYDPRIAVDTSRMGLRAPTPDELRAARAGERGQRPQGALVCPGAVAGG